MTSELKPEGSGLMTIYVNGTLDVAMEDTADDDWNDGLMRMGHRPGRPDDERFIGALDDIRIYQGVISPFKVQMILSGK